MCVCLSVCLSVNDFLSHQTPQFHEILCLDLFWANLGHEKARFSKFRFLRGLLIGYSVNFGPFSVVRGNLSHLKTRLGTMKFGQSASFYTQCVNVFLQSIVGQRNVWQNIDMNKLLIEITEYDTRQVNSPVSNQT